MDHKDYRLAAIMYTDIVGFSRMMENDETGTLKLMDFHNHLVKQQVDAFGGKIIKTIGDAFLVEFPTATNAVKCAVEIQNELEKFNGDKPKTALVLRIGVHLGDIYFSENDALGEGINIASRLQSLCRPGRVCISGEVHTLVSKKIELPIHALGAVTLKNISRGITAYEVITNGAAEPAAESDGNGQIEALKAGTAPLPAAPASDKASTLPATPQASPADLAAMPDVQQLRAFIFQNIKQAGRRLTVDEMRGRLPAEARGPSADAYLDSLADSGFLVRTSVGAPPSQPSPGGYGQTSGAYGQPQSQSGGMGGPGRAGPGFEEFGGRMAERADRWARRMERRFGPEASGHMSGVGAEIRREVGGAIREGIAQSLANRGPSYEQYMEQVDRRLEREETGFRSHLVPFFAVNAGLWVIWASTTLLGFPWPLIPMLAWGIGVASHWGTLRDRRREAAQLKNLPALEPKQFGLVRRLFKERRGWNGHLVSNVAVAGFLFVLNMITSPMVLWSIFPIAGMGIGLFSHLPVFKRKEQELLAQLSNDGVPIDVLTNPKNLKLVSDIKVSSSIGPIAAEAERIRARILRQVKSFKGPNPLGDDFETVLDNYVTQIKELSVRDREIDNILAALPVRDLEREQVQIQQELERCTDDRLRVEYDKSLEQIGKQKKAYGEMVSEQKVLKLRLSNAVNGLQQLEIDLARMRSLSAGAEVAAAGSIKSKSNELSQYLTDLRAGYQEIDALERDVFGGVPPSDGVPLASPNEPKPD
jgi:class 3 adenylate cyclase